MGTAETIPAASASTAPKPAPSTPRDLVAVMLRAAEKLQGQPDLKSARALLERGGEQLVQLLDPERRPDWAWFEILFEEDACRLPEALLRAGRILHREDFIACGVETLDWMMRGRVLVKCVDTMADACEAAFAGTGDLKWLMISRTAILARRAHPRQS
ncbi:hypothetical protein GON01_03420 [Sphingomonas sp. MAH-20]|uniref:Uncharacterized protein n=1 Tax=Sphingomonas horti TaxID=2682842 RepID=A0A6I4IYJ6_9SPHN|nr:hypothetical protein [Sphingomonas horti]